MSGNYFIHSLYPFQDSVFKLIMEVDDSFYLTGGTALGRHYLNHRYSDDLDLFVNRNVYFKELTDVILSQIKTYYPETDVSLLSEDFARIHVKHNKLSLKMEFINDVSFHAGEIEVAGFFHRVDSWQNILSNKVCALPRDEAKDLADIIFLSMNFSFTWKTIIGYAREKDMWVNEIEVSQMVQRADILRLKKILWVKEPDYDHLQKMCQEIAKDILRGEANSLAGGVSRSSI